MKKIENKSKELFQDFHFYFIKFVKISIPIFNSLYIVTFIKLYITNKSHFRRKQYILVMKFFYLFSDEKQNDENF